ncbi:RluA family pseudouridine synthase [Effusibacillus consociatus]|uniref:Pseudouridine synthase n=1 Tax=Effusibacillus consociatus TaxID=1117041 RepID=A0ABV9Q507_9BACL
MVGNSFDEIVSFHVPSEYHGKMVKELIRNLFEISRPLLRKIVGGQGVLVNGRPVYITSRLCEGDFVQLLALPESSEDILPEDIPFVIVHEDEDILVVNKQAGLVVHPTSGRYTGTLANGIVHYWQQKGETARFRPVHRLDMNTSGLLVVSKNHYAHQGLWKQLAKRGFRREYLAIVHGNPEEDSFTIDAPILKREDDPRERIVTPEGRSAITHVTVEKRFRDAALVRLRLETGRTHQIRVHMKYVRLPLFGDDLYGIGVPDGMERQALHAEILGFNHPRSGHWMEWKVELPEDMSTLLQKLQTGTE